MAATLIELRKKTTQTRLAGNGFDSQHFINPRIAAQMGYSRKLIRSLQNPSQKTQCRVPWIIGVWTGGLMRHPLAQLLAKSKLMQKPAPKNHPAMGR